MSSSRTILDLPPPLILDSILPLLPPPTLAVLRLVSRQFKFWVEDEVLWKRKVFSDFTFPPHATARMGGWFNLYRGLFSPDVYVWGQLHNGRLGIELNKLEAEVRANANQVRGGIPYPFKLNTLGGGASGAGAIVEIVAGGWSFHARTSRGKVWYWGTMDGEHFTGNQSNLRDPGKQVPTPRLLDGLGEIEALTGGRCHAVALTKEGKVVEWRSWGSLMLHESLLTATGSAQRGSEGGKGIKQLEAGWSFTSILNDAGEVWVWYSDWSEDAFQQQYYGGNPQAAMMYADPPGFGDQKLFPVSIAPLQLPPLPTSPSASMGAQQAEVEGEEGEKIIQIAAGEDFIIALTSHGHLYRSDLHLPPANFREEAELMNRVQEARRDLDHRDVGALVHRFLMQRFLQTRASWERLELFEAPQGLEGFNKDWVKEGRVGKISHISAHFRRFVAFLPIFPASWEDQGEEGGEDTLVLLGKPDTSQPELITELQARGVIKVTMGDYHYGALTSKGEVLTWGAFSKGALGNWSAPWTRNPLPTTNTTAAEGQGEAEGEEGERGWLSNLIPLPSIFRARGGRQPRIGFAGRGGRAAAAWNNALQQRGTERAGSEEDVVRPTVIRISPQPQAENRMREGGGGVRGGEPFAFDIAFAGWHSSALVMDAPAFASVGDAEGSEDGEEVYEDAQ